MDHITRLIYEIRNLLHADIKYYIFNSECLVAGVSYIITRFETVILKSPANKSFYV